MSHPFYSAQPVTDKRFDKNIILILQFFLLLGENDRVQ